MNEGFIPISREEYIRKHLKSNPGDSREGIDLGIRNALEAHKKGERCECGNPIWVIGSAVAGLSCFTCITGEARPDSDYEIDEALQDER